MSAHVGTARCCGRAQATASTPRHGSPRTGRNNQLWSARGQFEATSALVRSGSAEDVRWRALRFMAFDLPAAPAGFADRQVQMGKLIGNASTPYLRIIEQHRLSDTESLHRRLRAVVQAGGEGLMLHHQDNRYSVGRSNGLFKLKLHEDAEARVTGYVPGKGKYAGKIGALMVENDKGDRFRIGSGLSDAQRDDPPPIGALVTYRYNGLTVHGLPRFPRFLRLRPEP